MRSIGKEVRLDVSAMLAQGSGQLLRLVHRSFTVLLTVQNKDAAVEFIGHIFNDAALLKHPFAGPYLAQNGKLGANWRARPKFEQIVSARLQNYRMGAPIRIHQQTSGDRTVGNTPYCETRRIDLRASRHQI